MNRENLKIGSLYMIELFSRTYAFDNATPNYSVLEKTVTFFNENEPLYGVLYKILPTGYYPCVFYVNNKFLFCSLNEIKQELK
jgi:hypothetical protein